MLKIFTHIITWLVALSVLNSSIGIPGIDVKDFAINQNSNLNNWNEFESIYEWVAESVLKIKDAVPEPHIKHGNQHGVLKKYSPAFVSIRLQKVQILYGISHQCNLPVLATIPGKPLAGYITLFSPPPNA